VGAGAFGSVEEACAATIHITGRTAPGANGPVYEEMYPLYRELYPALRGVFARM
jgi:xylulokinase